MGRSTVARSAGTVLFSILMALVVASPVVIAGHGPLPAAAAAPTVRMADLAPALAADGTFRGAPGVEGMVDTSAWALVSNLATGEPPRFAPATRHVSAAAAGSWSALGSNGSGNGVLNSGVYALAVSGSNLYVGGYFSNAAGIPTADFVAEWNGSAWSALGSNGSGNGTLNGYVYALAASGSGLYVGGYFSNAAGIPTADYIAKWNGSAWSALGSNGSGDGALNLYVFALAVSGSDLYVGGVFSNAAGIPTADYIAKWNGSAWSALGSNGHGNGALNSEVHALAVSGSGLYVGGYFTDAAGIATADYIARWNGSAWSALGSNGTGNTVFALALSGSDLYVGGVFTNAAGIATADYIAKWHPGSAVVRKPDGRIRLGTGAFVGNNVYNTTGAGQSRTGSAARGKTIAFGISIQNDGTSADRFKVKATGAAASAYTVKYFHGTTNITAAVVAGTYKTPTLAPAATYLITAKVTVKSTAAAGSKVSRLVVPCGNS